MRLVALLVIMLFSGSTFSAVAAPLDGTVAGPNDECSNRQTGASTCARVDGPPVLYVYMASLTCNPPTTGDCADGDASLVAGVVYEETNGVAGLQRAPKIIGGVNRPQDAVLIA